MNMKNIFNPFLSTIFSSLFFLRNASSEGKVMSRGRSMDFITVASSNLNLVFGTAELSLRVSHWGSSDQNMFCNYYPTKEEAFVNTDVALVLQ
jgi:hypothetical protein